MNVVKQFTRGNKMKRLILIAAFAASPVFADTWAMPNKAGGEIVLVDKICPGYKHIMQAYTYLPSGKTMTGCWFYQDGMVRVVWDDNTEYTYPASAFHEKSKTRKGTSL